MLISVILQFLEGAGAASVAIMGTSFFTKWLAERSKRRAARKPTQKVEVRSQSGKFITTLDVPTHPTAQQRKKVDQQLQAAARQARQEEKPLAGVR